MPRGKRREKPWRVLAGTGPILHSTTFSRVLWYYGGYYGSTRGYYGSTRGYYVLWGRWILWVLWYYGRYYVRTHGYYGTIGYYRVLRHYGTTNGYYVVPVGTMVVPQTGYYRVLQAYTAEGMSRVMVRVRLGVCTPQCTLSIVSNCNTK